jgi:hypothetical protein
MSLPSKYRAMITKAYVPGQEVKKTPSREYIAIAMEVREWILDNYPPKEKTEK